MLKLGLFGDTYTLYAPLRGGKVSLESRFPRFSPHRTALLCRMYQSHRPEKPTLAELSLPGTCREIARVTSLGWHPHEEDRQGNKDQTGTRPPNPDRKEVSASMLQMWKPRQKGWEPESGPGGEGRGPNLHAKLSFYS